jgi:citrate synthase
MDPWRTAIVETHENSIRLHGYDVTSLMRQATFTDTIFLLHRGRMPQPAERALLDAILCGVADHGSGAPSCAAARLAASGNRQSLSAAVAAGILAIGDEHGGAGSACMELIGAGVERARSDAVPLTEVARRVVADVRARGGRIAGLGHRKHTVDPRTAILFDMARGSGLAGDGIAFMEALDTAMRELGKALRST